LGRNLTVHDKRALMGMPWASVNGLREAVPPAYAEFIGAQLLAHINMKAAA
jgi:DNA (cytosine-5)-methyltransferase 1